MAVMVTTFIVALAFTVKTESTLTLSLTATPPLKITEAFVELANALVLANTISGSTFEKNCVNVTFLFEGVPAGSSTTNNKYSLAADDSEGSPEMRLSAIYLTFYQLRCPLAVANNQYSVPFTFIRNLALDVISAVAVANIIRFESLAVVLAAAEAATCPC